MAQSFVDTGTPPPRSASGTSWPPLVYIAEVSHLRATLNVPRFADRLRLPKDKPVITTQPTLDLRHSEQVGDVRVRMVEALVRKQRGALAKIVPTTALASTSGQAERCLLASRFLIDLVVTSHDPKRPSFSENTDTTSPW